MDEYLQEGKVSCSMCYMLVSSVKEYQAYQGDVRSYMPTFQFCTTHGKAKTVKFTVNLWLVDAIVQGILSVRIRLSHFIAILLFAR